MHSRLLGPMETLRDAGHIDGAVIAGVPSLVEIERFKPSSIVLQRPLADAGLLTLRRLRAFSQAFKVYDLDCYPQVYEGGSGAGEDLLRRMHFGMMQADRVLVATAALAELVQGRHDDIRVLENVLPASWGRLQGKRRAGQRPRVGWMGCHDAYLLAEVVPMLAAEVDWVVLGDCPAALRPYLKEHHPVTDVQYLGAIWQPWIWTLPWCPWLKPWSMHVPAIYACSSTRHAARRSSAVGLPALPGGCLAVVAGGQPGCRLGPCDPPAPGGP